VSWRGAPLRSGFSGDVESGRDLVVVEAGGKRVEAADEERRSVPLNPRQRRRAGMLDSGGYGG